MNITKILAPVLVLVSIALSACEANEAYNELTDSKVGAFVYIAKANSPINDLTIFPFTDDERTFTFSATLGALGYPKSDIPVKFIINEVAFDSVNMVRQAAGLPLYEKFPADAYSISGTEAVIPAGKLTSNLLSVKYFSKKFDPKKEYLLPISIQQAGGYPVNSKLNTAFVIARVVEKLSDRTGWVATASSEQTYWENTGLASAVLDGNLDTYWHSTWDPKVAPFPHWLRFDMKSPRTVTKIGMAPRQNNKWGFTKFKIEGSLDGTTWVTLGNNLVFDPTKLDRTFQEYPVEPTEVRYLKVTMLEGRSGVAHLSEFIVYQY